MGRAYLIVIFIGGLLGSMCTRSERPAIQAGIEAGKIDDEDADRGSSGESSSRTADAMTLERSADGHFYADVQINGTSIRMLVDTGATGIALSRDDARRAGIATSISMPNVIGEGASGEVHGETITIDRIQLGGASADSIDAVVLDRGGMSLLGQQFLRNFESVEIKDDRMVLRG
jgi:aspartyl protease family protein